MQDSENKTYFPNGGCGAEKFGVCSRLCNEPGTYDWYEPHEPHLERDGFPWFYFIPTPDKLTEECREEYIRESEKLWGKEHWKGLSN